MAFEHESAAALFFGVRLKYSTPSARITKEKLETVLLGFQIRHPILRCRVVTDPTKDKYELEESNSTKLSVLLLPRNHSPTTWREYYEEHINGVAINCDDPTTPQNRVVLFQDDDADEADLVFHFQHYLCDGISTVQLIHQVLSSISGEEPIPVAPSFHTKSMDDCLWDTHKRNSPVFPSTGMVLNFSRKLARDANNVKFQKFTPFPVEVKHTGGKQQTSLNRTFVPNPVRLSEKDSKLFFLACKANKTTVTSAVACFLEEAMGLWDPKKGKKVGICAILMTNARVAAKPEVNVADMTLHVGSFSARNVPVDFSKKVDVWKRARDFKKQSANRNFGKRAIFNALFTRFGIRDRRF
jgi:hypothetical protein